MFCPKCGAILETYVKYCAGQPISALIVIITVLTLRLLTVIGVLIK